MSKGREVSEHMTPVGMALAEPEVISKIRYKNQLVQIDPFPVGTNPQHILNTLNKEETQQHIEKVRQELNGRKLIIAAGRVDYVKGNREMLEAYQRLLERRPDLHGKINFVMTCVSAAAGMRIYKTGSKSNRTISR